MEINNFSIDTDTNSLNLNPLGGTNNGKFTLMDTYFNRSVVYFLNGTL